MDPEGPNLTWGQLRTWDGHGDSGDSGWAQRVCLRGPSICMAQKGPLAVLG